MLNRRTITSLFSLLALPSALAVLPGCLGDDPGAQESNIGVDWDDPSAGPEGRWPGQTSFESAAPWTRIWGPFLRGMADGTTLENNSQQRVIEEGDIVKSDGDRLFVLNPYRGLMRVDASNVDHPTITGRLKLQGSPQEMYIRGNVAFVLMNGLYSWQSQQDYRSSVLMVDLTTMKLLAEHRVDGRVLESRIVGDALYVVSDEWQWDAQEQTTHVFSLNIENPAAVAEVERVSFPGNGHQIHVTSDYLFVAKYQYPGTAIQVIDIRNPQGYLHVGNNVEIDGYVQDRFMMDYSDGHLRVVSHKWSQGGHIFVDTFALDAANTTLSHSGQLDLADIGRLTAARFDGTRVYLVHMVQVDPLDVVDLQDPTAPKLLDRIEIPGWLERLEVRDGRILGVGFDQAGTPAPQKLCEGYDYEPLADGRKLSVALYDVSEAGEVCEAARVRFGTGNWQWSNGFRDDKAIKLLADEELLLVPYNEYTDAGYQRGVQLVDVDIANMELDVRGLVPNASQVDRSFLQQERLMALGNRELAVANIDDRDNPVVTANLELARNVVAFQPVLAGQFGVQLVGNYDEPAELRIVDITDADADKSQIWASMDLGAPAGELYVNGSVVTVYSRSYGENGPEAKLINVDVAKPFAPVIMGEIDLPTGYGNDVRPMMLTRFQPTADIVRVQKDLFVVSAPSEEGMKYSLVSNQDPYAPTIAYEHVQPDSKARVMDLKSWWGNLYVVSTYPVEDDTPVLDDHVVATDLGQQDDVATSVMPIQPHPVPARRSRVRYYVSRVTFDGTTPNIGSPINVPGRLVDVSKSGKVLTFLDNRWEKGQQQHEQKKELFTALVDWSDAEAPLLDGVPLTSGVEDVKVRGKAAYYTETWQDWRGPIVPMSNTVAAGQDLVVPEPEQPRTELVILSYDDPSKIHEASRTVVGEDGSYGTLQDVRQVDGVPYGFITLGWGAMAVMDMSNQAEPTLKEFVRTRSYGNNLVVSPEAGAAFMAGGMYGVETIQLRDPQGSK